MVQVLTKLSDGISGKVESEGQSAYFVIENASHTAKLTRVVLSHSALQQQEVSCSVALVS